MAGHRGSESHVQKLLGPVEIAHCEKQRTTARLGIHQRKTSSSPDNYSSDVLSELYGGPSGGHFGVNKTLNKVQQRFYWLQARTDTEKWCRQCDTCAASWGPQTRNRGQMHQYNVGDLFKRVAIDIAAEVLVANFFCRFGIPRELHSDQGRNFKSHLLQEVLQHLGVSKTRTTPLHPQSDGMVERYVKTIEEHLWKVVASHQSDWDERLPLFLLAYRASTHDTMGLTPASLVLGRQL
ncbi:hypothetical protein B7P43_G16132 [Cryptotermes secundus]|uniref:RNA-directed DNA polymerase n=1 Tax=Cryptotermes secundus TaxID=105785 RepID=A0A2J7R976_9NEOP|nr:hypothetical protein B7P43_G16132 [Cryptotermes secundus]